MSALAAALATNTTLTNLKLGSKLLSAAGFFHRLLTDAAIFFSLDSNQISDVSALGAALATNATLTTLE